MRKKFFGNIILIVSAIIAMPVVSDAADSREKPELSVEVNEGKPRFIHKNKQFSCSHKINNGGGCTRVSFYAELRGTEITPEGALKKLKLQIGLRDVEIELSSDLKKGSCLFDAVLKHELTHLALHRKVLKRFAPEVAKAVLSTAESLPVPITQAHFNRISNVLKKYVDRMMREDDKQNALMDTGDAYLYQQKQCLNE